LHGRAALPSDRRHLDDAAVHIDGHHRDDATVREKYVLERAVGVQ
jgi:hypothetical protein